ncbi:MAG TPA: type II toxin-antitoxin system VapB family antitoxin [Terriglobia bacterium]|nr:type II toxin-antitoxin system VapB family antitoxin [Terriglobia bacterium]
MSRINLNIDGELLRKAASVTRLKSKREVVRRALELLVRTEERKGILQYFGSGIWEGDPKALRTPRV